MRAVHLLGFVGISLMMAGGCSSDDEGDGSTDGSAGSGASAGSGTGGSSATDGGAATGGTLAGGTSGAGVGGTATDGSAGGEACAQTTCQGHLYLCGDCLDNDGDGKVDMLDPDCLGPCHNAEAGFHPCIPGISKSCKLDCYYDNDSGDGNDDCFWDHQCDPLSKAPDYPPQGADCAYTGGKPPSLPDTCDALYQTQSNECEDVCGPLTPNGCDCFGCCELPSGSGSFVWLGSTSDNSAKCEMSTCSLGNESDPTKCHPCTPVAACLNPCDTCEYCLGKQTLPPECFDGGAGTGGSAGAPGCPPDPVCLPGEAPCDYIDGCLAPCDAGFWCNTGCCKPIP